MNEILNIQSFDVQYTLPKVDFDLAKIESGIKLLTSKYGDLVVAEDDVPTMKKEIAQLNKISKAINDKKIEVSKLIKAPITEFETQMKALVEKVDALSKDLKKQVDEYDEKKKTQRTEEILAFPEWVSEYMVFNEEWLKSTATNKKIKAEMDFQRETFKNHCLLIETTCKLNGMKPDDYYLLLTQHKPIEYIVDKINNDLIVKETYANTPTQPTEEKVIAREEIIDTDKYSYTLKIKGTLAQLRLLKKYLTENNLEYEKLE